MGLGYIMMERRSTSKTKDVAGMRVNIYHRSKRITSTKARYNCSVTSTSGESVTTTVLKFELEVTADF